MGLADDRALLQVAHDKVMQAIGILLSASDQLGDAQGALTTAVGGDYGMQSVVETNGIITQADIAISDQVVALMEAANRLQQAIERMS